MNKFNQFLFTAAQTFYPRPTILFTEEPDFSEPVIFVANHEKNYGPGIMQLFFPITYRPWVIHRMLEPVTCREYICTAFFEERLNLPAPFSRWISGWIEPLLLNLMHSMHPIPVFRDQPSQIAQTFNDSLSALENGENLLIFPENGKAIPYSSRVKDFYTGFIYLARLYHRNTGKRLAFYPVSINPRQKTICVGKKVRFNPAEEYPQERERIRQHLLRQIDALYETPWNQPHTRRTTTLTTPIDQAS